MATPSLKSPAPPAVDARRPGVALVAGLGVLGLIGSLACGFWFWREARRVDEARFIEQCTRVGVGLEQKVMAVEALLRNLARALSAQESPDPADWAEVMNQESPQWNYPGILAIGYATNAAAAQTVDLLDRWAARPGSEMREALFRVPPEFAGDKEWRVWALEVYRDSLRPLDVYAREAVERGRVEGDIRVRRYQEPAAALERRTNHFKYREHDGRMQLLHRQPDSDKLSHAIHRDEVKITGRQPVLRTVDGAEVVGATMLVPTYDPRRHSIGLRFTPGDEEGFEAAWLRWNLNRGYVFAHLDFGQLLALAQGDGPQSVRVEIHATESSGASAASWLNEDGQPPHAGQAGFRASFRHTYSWPMYGGRWTLFFHTTRLFDDQSTRYRAVWAMGWGLTFTVLMCWTVGAQSRGRWRERIRAAELLEARDALQAVQGQRERLSADLHDGAIQSLYAVQLGLTETARELKQLSPAALTRLQESRVALDGVIRELRGFMSASGARGGRERDPGLTAALRAMATRFEPASAARILLECAASVDGRLRPTQAVQLANVAGNALSNAVRHAQASRIVLRLRDEAEAVALVIEDDGRGFDVAATTGSQWGLRLMHRRAAELGASLVVDSAPGKGTRIRLRLPLPPAPTGDATGRIP